MAVKTKELGQHVSTGRKIKLSEESGCRGYTQYDVILVKFKNLQSNALSWYRFINI